MSDKSLTSLFYLWVSKFFPQDHLLKRLFFPSRNGLGILIKNQLTLIDVSARAYFCSSCAIPWVCTSVFMAVPQCYECCSFVISLEIRNQEELDL